MDTVVAVFDTKQDAQSALEALASEGISQSQARITSTDSTSTTSTTSSTASSGAGEKSFGDMVADFFGFGDDDDTYTEAVRRGGYVLTVDVADEQQADRVEAVLTRFGPVDIDQRTADWRATGWQPSRASLSQDATLTGVKSTDNAGSVIPVTEEQLAVGKREVQRGGVRVITRTVERPVEADVSLREERATVTRRPVDRAVTDADTAFKDATIEVRETAEEAVVGKTARVVEEVEIGKESSVREETVHDTVRKTEVDVEQLGTTGTTGTKTTGTRTTGTRKGLSDV